MEQFPGTIARQRGKVVLNEEQIEWLRRWYPVTEMRIIQDAMGVSEAPLYRFIREYGLKRTKAGLAAIRKRHAQAIKASNEANGCYDRKRGREVSAATRAGYNKYIDDVHTGRRRSPKAIERERDPQRWKERYETMSCKRKELIRKEQRRMMYGLPRQTDLTIVLLQPYTQSQKAHRCNAIKRGYLLDADCSEGSPGRYVIYYDDETPRSSKFEENCIKDGFTIKCDE